jgi:hypothetical protein
MSNKLGHKCDQLAAHENTVFLDVFPVRWPADLGAINPDTFRQCGFGGAATLNYGTGQIGLYGPDDLKSLAEKLNAAQTVAGFNCLSFDQAVIAGAGIDTSRLHWFDLMASIREQVGHGCSLADLVKANFGISHAIPLEQHREQILKQNQIMLLQKAVNAVNHMARLFTRGIEAGELLVPERLTGKLVSVKLNWREI